MPNSRLTVKALSKKYGTRSILKELNLQLDAGQLLLICGVNGSGKSTLLRLLATVICPTSGSLLFNEEEVEKDLAGYRRRLGFATDSFSLYQDLTWAENLSFFSSLYRLHDQQKDFNAQLAQLGLADCLTKKLSSFSHGMRRKASLLLSFLHDPEVCLLDEPEAGLDSKSRTVILDWLTNWKSKNKIIVIASHHQDLYRPLLTKQLTLSDGKLEETE